MTTPQEVADMLNRCPGVTDAVPVIVSVDNLEYVGGRYTAATGDVRIYLLLDSITNPAEWADTVVFTTGDDEEEWYLGAYAESNVTDDPRYARLHPLGPWFQLHRWSCGHDIDIERPRLSFTIEVRS